MKGSSEIVVVHLQIRDGPLFCNSNDDDKVSSDVIEVVKDSFYPSPALPWARVFTMPQFLSVLSCCLKNLNAKKPRKFNLFKVTSL